MTLVQGLVVSPLARYAAGHVEVGSTSSDLADRAAMTHEHARRALEELQQKVFVLLVSGDRVTASDVDLVVGSGSLRYSV